MTVVEANLVTALARRELGDDRAAFAAVECALDLAEPDRLVLPFAMTGSCELLEAMPLDQTAHPALLAEILDVHARIIHIAGQQRLRWPRSSS